MGDAVCGPSNPLQLIKQQTQVDRSLQQDRLTSRHAGAAHGFRSANPAAHLVDAEFEAFQAGAPLADVPFHPQHNLPVASPAPFFPSQALPSWAADFQRLQVSAPVPMQQQVPQFTPQSGSPSWAADFRQHIAQPVPRAQSSSPSPWAFQQRARYGATPAVFGQQISERPLSKGKQAVRDDFDEAAFARAFDMVAQELDPAEDEGIHMESSPHGDIFQDQEAMEDVIEKAMKETVFDPEMVLGQVSIDDPGSYAASDMDYNGAGLEELPERLQEYSQQPNAVQETNEMQQDHRAEDDALAYTAGELLDRVKDNQSDKFQNSQFLALMQKLKDREVRVEGDKMVETVGTMSTPYIPIKRNASPDSGYGSAPSTPPLMQEPTFASAGPATNVECDVLEEHRWDHWESPYT